MVIFSVENFLTSYLFSGSLCYHRPYVENCLFPVCLKLLEPFLY